MSKQEEAARLAGEGFGLLRDGRLDEAVRVGERLKELRHSSAFEILALAHDEAGDTERAIRELEEGVEKAPGVWVLWQLLGNFHSDSGKYAEAQEAYRRALACPNVDSDSVKLNVAIALGREDKTEQALTVLEEIATDDQRIGLRAQSTRVQMLNRTGQHEAAIELAGSVTISEHTISEHTEDEAIASLHAEHAEAVWRSRSDRAAALELAWKAIEFNRNESTALWLIREIDGERSERSSYFKVMLEGPWIWAKGDSGSPLGFFTTYDVIAECAEDALRFIKRFEPPEIHESLRIEECERIEPRPNDPKGIYWTTGYNVFPLIEE